MSQAVTNVIQHGSTSPDDQIRIGSAQEAGVLVFEVLDTGLLPASRGLLRRTPDSGKGIEFCDC